MSLDDEPAAAGAAAASLRQALLRSLARETVDGDGNRTTKLERIADRLVDAAAEGGDLQAIRELADRIDGKARQATAGDAERHPVRTIITGVPRPADDAE